MIDLAPDEHLWTQVLNREAEAGFLYAVTTMGIYCRPGCPSPLPDAAERPVLPRRRGRPSSAGYRACKRCDPKGERAASHRTSSAMPAPSWRPRQAIPALDALAQRSGYSRFHFLRMFRDHTG